MKKDKKLYNYVVNTLGLSKEMVLEYAATRLDDLISKHIKSKLDSNTVERLILDRVTKVITEGLPKGSSNIDRYSREDFDTYLRKIVRQVVEEKINEDFSVDVKVIRAERKTIGGT